MNPTKWYSGATVLMAGALLLACATSCNGDGSKKSNEYTVTVPSTESQENMKGVLVNYDTSEPIDSAVVKDGTLVFKGTIDNPTFVRLILDGSRKGQLILEPGDILFSTATRQATGSPLNEKYNGYSEQEGQIISAMRALDESDSLYMEKASALQARYDSLTNVMFNENTENPIGYTVFVDRAYEWTLDTLDANLQKYPQFASSKRLANLRRSLELKQATSPGQKYKDFSIEYDGKLQSLGDYVKPGKYTLVDFWASWCRPCLQEIQTIKKLYDKFGPNGTGQLNVVGVAVWDEPQNTQKAIAENEIPWSCILNAQSVPTDIYGIPAIPCIILIGPDGVILSRDKQGKELISDVTKLITEGAK